MMSEKFISLYCDLNNPQNPSIDEIKVYDTLGPCGDYFAKYVSVGVSFRRHGITHLADQMGKISSEK